MLLKVSFISSLLCSFVCANMAPNYPEPGTVWKTGKQYTITWFDDKQSPHMKKSWKNFKIDFMTGDNDNQKFLQNVATNLDASKTNSFNWTAPEVEPHASVYFLMFTNGENAWTTRFGITGPEGKLDKPEHSTQPDGASIPWGVGKLVGGSINQLTVKPTGTYSMNPAMASAAEKNAKVKSVLL
ncbi:hypothetical protein CU098_007126 [Rhizopus stolonifer]|uniref:Yeast cell wall synthesis Kre9/Knh1-like N-terminal domain-containing protein n=1 Tax=Rhizopus stolonifer TaxID=4846 RepID=A0A367KI87_RHIST|nr:hypothetical protein CU098_007126 [Rhizopus stolonifer]